MKRPTEKANKTLMQQHPRAFRDMLAVRARKIGLWALLLGCSPGVSTILIVHLNGSGLGCNDLVGSFHLCSRRIYGKLGRNEPKYLRRWAKLWQ